MSEYSNFISICQSKGLIDKLQYLSYMSGQLADIPAYELFFYDGAHLYATYITQAENPEDFINFETQYKNSSNKRIEAFDVYTNANRVKIVPVKGNLQLCPIYLSLGSSIFESYYPEQWIIDVSTPGKTLLTFQPAFGYYLEGGSIQLIGDLPATSITINAILAPDIPQSLGGSFVFIGGKKFVKNSEYFEISSTPKYIAYDVNIPINHLKIEFSHSAADNSKIEFLLKIHKEE